ncbi:MAG: Fe2+-dependent dioxygenase [Gammaproteobacteria bacterium]
MLIVLENVFTTAELAEVRGRAEKAQYVPGATTAGEGSRSRKHNLQIAENDADIPWLQKTVLEALARHQIFQFLAAPKYIMPPMFNRYDTGMYYHDHVDFSLVGGGSRRIRTDLAMTLFLSAANEYDGGELVVQARDGIQAIKLDKNQAVVYAAGQLHRVNPVIQGSRLAVVTTIQSFIRDEGRRDLLADVVQLAGKVQELAPQSETARLANKIHANLLRLWAE